MTKTNSKGINSENRKAVVEQLAADILSDWDHIGGDLATVRATWWLNVEGAQANLQSRIYDIKEKDHAD